VPTDRSQERSKCVCGLHALILECFTLNTEAEGRRKDFKPPSKALSQLVEAFRNKDTLKKAKKAYKDAGIQWTFNVERVRQEVQEGRLNVDVIG
jgi:hypothetical protein